MKTRLIISIIALIGLGMMQNTIAQTNDKPDKKTWAEKKAERKELKAERRALQDSIDNIAFQKALAGILDTTFVLESFQVYDRKGNTAHVSETTNFVMVNKETVTVQLSFPFVTGPNGVGGITLEGNLTNFEISQTKKGLYIIKITSFGSSLTADITLTVFPGSNRAEAQVSAITLPYKVRYDGYLYHSNDSKVFKGRALY